MQNDTGPPGSLKLGAIRRIVTVAFEETARWQPGIANGDTEIDCDFQDFLAHISQGLKRKIVIVATPPKGRKFTIDEVAEYIDDHQAQFELIPENPQDQNTETTERV